MARRGDGIYQRGKVWRPDFIHEGKRHVIRIERDINKTAASEIARVKGAGILKGEAELARGVGEVFEGSE